MTEKEFIDSLKIINIVLNDTQLKQFKTYLNFLIDYNQKCNLTAIKTSDEIYLKHFYDSLLILKYRFFEGEKILDLGSGPGFPGVPLKIVCPDIKLTCLDSNGKKTQFLLQLREKLGLDFEVINSRAEDFVKNRREYYDYVVSRAFSNMPVLCELAIPFVKVNGEVIAYKSDISKDDGTYAANELGALIKDVYVDSLPIENSKRTFVCVQKKCKTNVIYPRRYDKILKKPLQNVEK